MTPLPISYSTSPAISNAQLNTLFTTAWPNHIQRDFQPVVQRSLAYICAHDDTTLVGFVNIAWDGGVHAFLLDTTVHAQWQRRGIGRELVLRAVVVARAGGIEWVHVDYEPHHAAFYHGCGFQPTEAGLIHVR